MALSLSPSLSGRQDRARVESIRCCCCCLCQQLYSLSSQTITTYQDDDDDSEGEGGRQRRDLYELLMRCRANRFPLGRLSFRVLDGKEDHYRQEWIDRLAAAAVVATLRHFFPQSLSRHRRRAIIAVTFNIFSFSSCRRRRRRRRIKNRLLYSLLVGRRQN